MNGWIDMRFCKKLYVSDDLKKKQDSIVKKIAKGKYPLNVYVLTLRKKPGSHMEFYPAAMLYQSALRDDDLLVVGLATCYDDALYLIETITEEALKKTNDIDLRSFILGQEEC